MAEIPKNPMDDIGANTENVANFLEGIRTEGARNRRRELIKSGFYPYEDFPEGPGQAAMRAAEIELREAQ